MALIATWCACTHACASPSIAARRCRCVKLRPPVCCVALQQLRHASAHCHCSAQLELSHLRGRLQVARHADNIVSQASLTSPLALPYHTDTTTTATSVRTELPSAWDLDLLLLRWGPETLHAVCDALR